ncbi:FAD-binding domain-containing protein [Shimia sp. SDUM112013]|uniref:FAD-binding domain-containing protein n=1 Tax=Shimia sp. SDUM112013 TaxID=3136160 RepID=UPI0032F035D5
MTDTVLLWFKRDLRISDHPALAWAARLGRVVPVFIVEPGYWQLPDSAGRQFEFVRESVADLEQALAGIGLPMCLRVGAAVQVLEDLRVETGATHLVSHEEIGNDWTFQRDRAVADWAHGAGVRWHELPQSGVVRRLSNRDDWARHRNRYMAAKPIPVPRGDHGPQLRSDAWPNLSLHDYCPDRQAGGRTAGLATLDSFLHVRGRTYRKAMSSPLDGAVACSRLSPHLAFGTLSVREVAQRTSVRQKAVRAEGRRDGWSGSFKSFQSRLAWRDHFMQKLEDQPALEWQCLHSAYEGMRPEIPDAERLDRWCEGATGVPFVDACMRSLRATGWLNFRMRSMLMAFASYHLWLDWCPTGRHLARQFTDYEPGIHWPQVQMQSGTTGMNTIRIYNPVKQGQDQDPTGVFTRRWVPELEAVPDMFLQTPWLWPGFDKLRYPAPVVDLEQAARKARETVWARRRGAGFREEAQGIVKRHASRKTRLPRKRRRKDDAAQLDFGF